MSKAQVLANLQMLLNRVRARAAEPRVPGSTAHAPEPAALAPEPAARFSEPAARFSEPAAPAPAIAARPAAEDADVSVGMSTWTPPAGGADGGIDVEVDVEIEVSDSLPPEAEESLAASPIAAPEEAPARTESESEERLVAAQPVSPETTPESYAASDAERTPSTPPDVVQAAAPIVAAEPAGSVVALAHGEPAEPAPLDALPHDSWTPPATASPQPPPQTVPELEMDRGSGSTAAADDTTLEAAPASSRRPVEPEEEQLADMAFGPGAPQPPRHTPPPESGRLPAAPPDEFDDADVTGVRDATALANGDEAEPAVRGAEPIAPEASRPVLAATGDVADVVGPPPRFVPKTFAELLEATLSL